MPILAPTNGQEAGQPPAAGQPQVAPHPFVTGAREMTHPFHDKTTALASSTTTQVGPESVVARGFMRHIALLVTASGGDGSTTAAVADEEAPFSIFDVVRLIDTNGTPIVEVSGYGLYLLNKYGGIAPAMPDPKASPAFSDVDSDGDFAFIVRIPVEISGRDALGALANKNASQTFQIEYVLASGSTVYSTQPADAGGTVLPSVRVRAYLEAWSTPPQVAPDQRPIAQVPPAHGTTQYVRESVYNVESGDQEIRLNRVGNFVRFLMATYRTTAGALGTTQIPDPITLTYDGRDIERMARDLLRHRMAERYAFDAAEGSALGLDKGTVVWDFDHDLDGRPGWGERHGLLATTGATDLRIAGDFGAAGSLKVITVDVAPVGPVFG